MWNKKPILSICIPTYNREKTLKRLLDSVVNQDWFCDDIEIIVDDGPSTDNTKSLVDGYQSQYQNIKYFRNKEAIGMLPAILEAISFSSGEYTWLFGSDDFMHKDSLSIVLNIIKQETPKIILSNRLVFKKDWEINIDRDNILKYVSFKWFNDFATYLWLDEKDKFEDKHNYFTFMSVFCFKTLFYKESLEFTLKNISNEWELLKNYFNYILILYSNIFSKDIITVIENPHLVYCQAENHNRTHNTKIVKDIKELTNYVKKKYIISPSCNKTLNRFIFRWWSATYIISPIRKIFEKIWLYNSFSQFWRKYILHSYENKKDKNVRV